MEEELPHRPEVVQPPLQEVEVEIFLQEGVLHPQPVEGQIPQI